MEEDNVYYVKGLTVVSSDGKFKGKTTGGHRLCKLEGCRGLRLGVRWDDGDLSFPCTEGMEVSRKGKIVWKII